MPRSLRTRPWGGAAKPERENHPVAAHRVSLTQRHRDKGLRAICGEKLLQLRPVGHRPHHTFEDTLGVTVTGSDHHERLPGVKSGVLDDVVDHGAHFPVDTLNHPR